MLASRQQKTMSEVHDLLSPNYKCLCIVDFKIWQSFWCDKGSTNYFLLISIWTFEECQKMLIFCAVSCSVSGDA
jgi:hypothetical protein